MRRCGDVETEVCADVEYNRQGYRAKYDRSRHHHIPLIILLHLTFFCWNSDDSEGGENGWYRQGTLCKRAKVLES
jgi:hypothetical protein